ncbi:MAG: TAXI family TRAP transporter solute-binding subunit [Gammaproteobacteria bacterium]|nr:TAXI family TRAP transporter solute-binding subunit [Gammaproteobacteria bacterium]
MAKNLNGLKQGIVDTLGTWGVAIVVLAAGIIFTYQFVQPAPPNSIVLATGQDGGAYRYYGQRFAEYLATQGIAVELLETAGSVENLNLLESGEIADLGFVQGGLAEAVPTENVMALGSLYLEPVWFFVRNGVEVTSIDDLVGMRLAVGAEGSGTRVVVLNVLGAHGINSDSAELLDTGPAELPRGFADESIDAAFLIGGPGSDLIVSLLNQPGINLYSLERAAAYERRYSYVSRVDLPQGVLDLQLNLPVNDIDTVALTAMLAANSDLHPALVDLLLIAAADIFGGHGLLVDAGEFPTSRYVDLPLSEDAERHFKNGAPFLMRYLPFWAATLIDRLWIMLLPIIGLAIPLVKLLPPAYRWRIRKRLLNLYTELESIDPLVSPLSGDTDRAARIERLNALDAGSVIGSIPKTYTDDIYKLRRDIDLVRRRLTEA